MIYREIHIYYALEGKQDGENNIQFESLLFFSVYYRHDLPALKSWDCHVYSLEMFLSFFSVMLWFNNAQNFWFEISNEDVLTGYLITRFTALMCVSADACDLWKAESNFIVCLKFPKPFPILLSVLAVPVWPACFRTGDFLFF